MVRIALRNNRPHQAFNRIKSYLTFLIGLNGAFTYFTRHQQAIVNVQREICMKDDILSGGQRIFIRPKQIKTLFNKFSACLRLTAARLFFHSPKCSENSSSTISITSSVISSGSK